MAMAYILLGHCFCLQVSCLYALTRQEECLVNFVCVNDVFGLEAIDFTLLFDSWLIYYSKL